MYAYNFHEFPSIWMPLFTDLVKAIKGMSQFNPQQSLTCAVEPGPVALDTRPCPGALKICGSVPHVLCSVLWNNPKYVPFYIHLWYTQYTIVYPYASDDWKWPPVASYILSCLNPHCWHRHLSLNHMNPIALNQTFLQLDMYSSHFISIPQGSPQITKKPSLSHGFVWKWGN